MQQYDICLYVQVVLPGIAVTISGIWALVRICSMTPTICLSVVNQGSVLDFLLCAFNRKRSQHFCDHIVSSGHHLWCACNCYCSPVCNFYQI